MTNIHSTTSGTLGISAYFPLYQIPSIVSEWSALFPLVCHLATYEEDHRMVGQLALAGHLTVGLFPKLGYLNGIRRLLQGGPEFLDRANAKGDSVYKVWDVKWGSVFTRANGSATSLITDYAFRKHQKTILLPESVTAEPRYLPGAAAEAILPPNPGNAIPTKSTFRRHQELHIIQISRNNRPRTFKESLTRFTATRFGKFLYHLILVILIIVLCLFGAFGSAAIITNGLVSKLVCKLLRTERPSGYLENNENHDGCMLSAVHENANTWYLYVGDRGVIDWLHNKTMLSTPSASRIVIAYFLLAHILQLLAMTFVAAQKGIDGLCLVVLLLINYAYQYLLGGHRMAEQWLSAEGVCVNAHTFRFTGRTPMIGAVHIISEARDAAWIDALLAPCPRVKVWLDELKCAATMRSGVNSGLQALSPSDRSWVLLNSQLTIEAARLIQRKISGEKTTESLYPKESS